MIALRPIWWEPKLGADFHQPIHWVSKNRGTAGSECLRLWGKCSPQTPRQMLLIDCASQTVYSLSSHVSSRFLAAARLRVHLLQRSKPARLPICYMADLLVSHNSTMKTTLYRRRLRLEFGQSRPLSKFRNRSHSRVHLSSTYPTIQFAHTKILKLSIFCWRGVTDCVPPWSNELNKTAYPKLKIQPFLEDQW